MIRTRLRTIVPRAALALVAAVLVAPTAGAQASIGTQGFGYPVGGGSVRTNGTGGAFAEFDALTPTNPAAIGGVSRTVITAQAEPELRKLTVNGVSEKSTLQRIPLIMLILPVRRGVAISLSATSFLDRTFSTTTTGSARIDGRSVPTNDQTDVRDRRAGGEGNRRCLGRA